MSTEQTTWLSYVTLAVSLYGAGLASFVALQQNRSKLQIRGLVDSASSQIEIEISNPSGRKARVARAVVAYGIEVGTAATVYEITAFRDQTFEPGHGECAVLTINELQEAAKAIAPNSRHYARIWLIVKAYGGSVYGRPMEFDQFFVEPATAPRSRPFIAAHKLLGFALTCSPDCYHSEVESGSFMMVG